MLNTVFVPALDNPLHSTLPSSLKKNSLEKQHPTNTFQSSSKQSFPNSTSKSSKTVHFSEPLLNSPPSVRGILESSLFPYQILTNQPPFHRDAFSLGQETQVTIRNQQDMTSIFLDPGSSSPSKAENIAFTLQPYPWSDGETEILTRQNLRFVLEWHGYSPVGSRKPVCAQSADWTSPTESHSGSSTAVAQDKENAYLSGGFASTSRHAPREDDELRIDTEDDDDDNAQLAHLSTVLSTHRANPRVRSEKAPVDKGKTPRRNAPRPRGESSIRTRIGARESPWGHSRSRSRASSSDLDVDMEASGDAIPAVKPLKRLSKLVLIEWANRLRRHVYLRDHGKVDDAARRDLDRVLEIVQANMAHPDLTLKMLAETKLATAVSGFVHQTDYSTKSKRIAREITKFWRQAVEYTQRLES